MRSRGHGTGTHPSLSGSDARPLSLASLRSDGHHPLAASRPPPWAASALRHTEKLSECTRLVPNSLLKGNFLPLDYTIDMVRSLGSGEGMLLREKDGLKGCLPRLRLMQLLLVFLCPTLVRRCRCAAPLF
ncbi:hypothetical protein SEVIR_9G141000v4 [Setaria viridis]|uniref:Uncharacterized protein n=2 Tax=Setaria TaxID=4554 RepID=A0A368SGN0_SETIT|nr:uncharacterized protein LOC111255875 [Setaria italica]XP_034572503.1 uncharacterized protein LOC117837052 [Setaria viridis]RCV41523.1 hypothetical protein SETIT_9G142800v2 [Setaria italica]TKV92093.1 hypothetical protein SEVIR_9G141000v2 [Setaria viridis]